MGSAVSRTLIDPSIQYLCTLHEKIGSFSLEVATMADSYAFLFFCVLLPLIIFFLLTRRKTQTHASNLPKSYPFLGSALRLLNNVDRLAEWTTEILKSTPSLTYSLNFPTGQGFIVTANAAVVEHILKTKFDVYEKGEMLNSTLRDFLGDGIFSVDGGKWKFQRQIASQEFNIRSLRKFLHSVIHDEISGRLIPALRIAASHNSAIDFQQILQQFGFDSICKIAFGYDPECLSSSPTPLNLQFAAAFETAARLTVERFHHLIPFAWKIKRFLNVGSEKELKIAVSRVRDMAREIIRNKKQEIEAKSAMDEDLLSRFLQAGLSDEKWLMDIVISFILAGQDTTSTALTWFFWLLSENPTVQDKILKEIGEKVSESAGFDEVKQLLYTHAAICESMRLFPPIPMETRSARNDDVLPDGTFVKKGSWVTYNSYAMGRLESVWGADWAEFRPERWLEKTPEGDKWSFVNRDAYTYPVFHGGPRICLGKEMAFIQMKSVISAVLPEFNIVPASATEPKFVQHFVAKMKGGFPVRIQARN